MSRFVLTPLAVFLVLTSTLLGAQSLVGVPEFIRLQREAFEQDRQVVMSAYELAAKARRAALEPLRQKDLVLNTQERLWRNEQRDLRLQGKQPDELSQP
jgi:hypothetical protein